MKLKMRKAPWDVPGASVVIDFRPYLGRVPARKEWFQASRICGAA
jgi:hypothetical protein